MLCRSQGGHILRHEQLYGGGADDAERAVLRRGEGLYGRAGEGIGEEGLGEVWRCGGAQAFVLLVDWRWRQDSGQAEWEVADEDRLPAVL